MLRNYIKIAWRSLLKNKTTGFINIAGLAIGMAVTLMIGLWLQDELTFNKYHKNYDQLAQLYLHQSYSNKVNTSMSIALPSRTTLEEEFGADFENLSLASWNFQHVLTHENKQFLKKGMFVEPVFPEMFSLDLIAGDFEKALQEPRSILITESLAKAFFGAKNPMGKVIRMDATDDLIVTGVFKDLPKNSNLYESTYFLPWSLYEIQESWVKRSKTKWGEHSFQLYAQLNENSDITTVSEKIKDIEKLHNPGANPEYFLFPMAKWHLHSNFENGVNAGGRIQFVWLFGIIGLFVLILACINFMNLSTARSEKRAREVGIRKTIGSMRSQLIGQFLSESLMVASIAMILALISVYFPLEWFNEIAGKELSVPHTNPKFWLIVIGFTLCTGLLAGSYPAFYLSSFEPLKVLKGTFQSGRWSKLPRQVLVTTQFTVSIALIIGTIVVYQQIQHAKNRPIGYERNSVIQFMSNNESTKKVEVFRDELLKTGMIEEVAYSFSPITSVWSNGTGFSWEGKDENVLMSFGKVSCSHEFGKTVGWEIKEGRDFSREFSTDTSTMILNEAAVEQIGLEDIVGKMISYAGDLYQVIGVVNNIVMESPWRPIKPTVFRLDPQRINVHTVKLKSDVPVKDAISAVQTVFKKHSPSSPFEYEFTDEEYNEKFESEERIGKIAYIFAFLAIFISCLGLFGLSAFVAERRTKEIGIRKVLGATVANLWAMQSKGFINLILLACLIAAPLAWYFLDGWLADYDYRIELSWGVFVASAILALMVTLLTVSYQSVRAALMNPAKSLKDE